MGKPVLCARIGELEEAKPKGIAGQAIKSCCFCGLILASSGGPGLRTLCEACFEGITQKYSPLGEALRVALHEFKRRESP